MAEPKYAESDYIMISALQHVAVCPRQCALIHNELAWEENRFTAEGDILHERVDNGGEEKRGDLITARRHPHLLARQRGRVDRSLHILPGVGPRSAALVARAARHHILRGVRGQPAQGNRHGHPPQPPVTRTRVSDICPVSHVASFLLHSLPINDATIFPAFSRQSADTALNGITVNWYAQVSSFSPMTPGIFGLK